ncbi:alpha/beta hydrolase [Nocardioides sp. MJB4]|uniref:Alpha/beta hydrolase n=2 Tax=Nocardioides donggukensis TaxID=2774019 RepID=A0A927PYJ4_9ACTN|nr:alpha/beta hydrolase [Nocardioides donggukensis]
MVGLGTVAACASPGGGTPGGAGTDDEEQAGVETIPYGDDPAQFGELTRPPGASKGVAVVIHGGFWRAQYDLSLGRPLAASLAERGWTAWNLEYRRVGNGGGVPQTLDDVAAGIDALADLADMADLDLSRVVTIGHSAGGHLAAWAAARGRFAAWQPERVPVTGVISQAGVLDFDAAVDAGLGAGAVSDFAGELGSSADQVDPARQAPLEVPVRCVHGRSDTIVPIEQSRRYVEAAVAAGADASLTEVDGDHFVLIDAGSEAWARTLELLDRL